jgi:hypothetical protein
MLNQNGKMNFIQKICIKMANIIINGSNFIGNNLTVNQSNNVVDVFVDGKVKATNIKYN